MTDETDQVHRAYDDSPQRFRDKNAEDSFSGANGVLFEQAMSQTRMAVCLCDPSTEDSPIVFANRAFLELTGYSEEEVVGRNCRFLQGPGTDPEKISMIREALEAETVVVVEILNYRKDGSSFWNALHLGPIYDDAGKLLYFFGSQWNVSDVHAARAEEAYAKALSRELSHRMKNMFSVIGAIVNITGRAQGMQEEVRVINDRIQALGRAYEPTLDDASLGSIELGQAIRSVLAPYDPEGQRIRYQGTGLRVDPNVVSALGLTFHELATNAVKYGALSSDNGSVDVVWGMTDTAGEKAGGLEVVWTESGGPAVSYESANEGTGHDIMRRLMSLARGDVACDWKPEGLVVTVSAPASLEQTAP